jgi:hypothetical protein
VRVLRLDTEERKIGLTLLRGEQAAEMIAKAPPPLPLPPPLPEPVATDEVPEEGSAAQAEAPQEGDAAPQTGV